jgi:phage tail-like protein
MEPVAPYGSLLIEGAGERRQVALKLGSNTLGRAPECDIQLDVEGVSREHARIVCTSQRCLIADRGSRNGTFVNDVRLEPNQQRQLQNGDVLKIGVFRIRYNAPRAARTPPQPLRQRQSDSAQTSARPTRPGVDAGKLIPPANQRSRYLDYLPPSYDCEPESFFNNFLLIFESVLGPLEQMVGQLHHYLNPRLTPEQLLTWLAAWLDAPTSKDWPLERRRLLIQHASELYRWRGSRSGIAKYVEVLTGVVPEIIEPWEAPPQALGPDEFMVILELPAGATIDRALVARAIEAAKPAHTTFVLEIRSRDERPASSG